MFALTLRLRVNRASKTRGDKRQALMKDATKREVEGEMRRRMKRGD